MVSKFYYVITHSKKIMKGKTNPTEATKSKNCCTVQVREAMPSVMIEKMNCFPLNGPQVALGLKLQ